MTSTRKKIAVIQGIPRKKENPSLNPEDPLEIDKRKVRLTKRFFVPVGVLGYPGSGRKTLAHRFSKEGKGPFTEEVPVKNVYGCHLLEKVPYDGLGDKLGFNLLLKLYIIDPATLSPHTPPFYIEDWNDFSCTIIVFDINDRKTFDVIPRYIRILREPYFRIRDEFFIVGNKSDLRRTDGTQHTQVTETSAIAMADALGATYYEVSAKQDVNIFDLLWAVRLLSPLRRYVIK